MTLRVLNQRVRKDKNMDRRRFLKFSAAALSVAALPAFASQQGKSPKPNVLLIFTDDQGTLDLGCYGATKVQTPNIDTSPEF